MTKSKRKEIARKLKALKTLSEGELQHARGGGDLSLSSVQSFSTLSFYSSIDWVGMAVTCGSYNL